MNRRNFITGLGASTAIAAGCDVIGFDEFFKNDDPVHQIFIIPENNHPSINGGIGGTPKGRVKFQVKFNETARYTLPTHDQADWNKLIGFSECNKNHENFSARVGWRYLNDQLQLTSFIHENGMWVPAHERIVDVNIHEWVMGELITDFDNNEYHYSINGSHAIIPRSDSIWAPSGGIDLPCSQYWLYPYFGGNQVAPHKIEIEMLVYL